MIPRRLRWPALIGALVAAVAVSLYHGFGSGLATFLAQQGREEIAEGDLQGGVRKLEQAHDIDPARGGSARLLAIHAAASGDTARAIELLNEVRDQGNESPEVLDLLGRLREESGDTDGALECFERLKSSGQIAGDLGLARLRGDRRIPPGETARWHGVALLHLEDALGGQGYGTPAAATSLQNAQKAGIRAISLRVPGRQPSVSDPTITYDTRSAGAETDIVVRRTLRDAHLLGMRVLLKPHVMLDKITGDEWRGTLRYDDTAKLDTWWKNYSAFILHYARLAREENVEAYCIGVELRAMVEQAPERWVQLIGDVREVYDGQLTYAANWYHEFQEVPFWSQLDLIGVQFFFPISEQDSPTLEQLQESMGKILIQLAELSFGHGRPVLLTEVGYKSVQGATREPWQWPTADSVPDAKLQARAYEAILTMFGEQPWFRGLFWWNWLTDPSPGPKFEFAFTPQGKPAEEVIRKYWGLQD